MKPKQFDFQREWNTTIKLIRGRPKVVAAMDMIARHWFEISASKRDEAKEFDAIQAEAEFNLDLMTFAVLHWDLHWQREWTRECCNTHTQLSLAIAETLYPSKKWERLENEDYEVVTDDERTVVFDFQNFDRLPAGASLLMVKDSKYCADDLDSRAIEKFFDERARLNEWRIRKLQDDIEFFDSQKDGNVVPIKKS